MKSVKRARPSVFRSPRLHIALRLIGNDLDAGTAVRIEVVRPRDHDGMGDAVVQHAGRSFPVAPDDAHDVITAPLAVPHASVCVWIELPLRNVDDRFRHR